MEARSACSTNSPAAPANAPLRASLTARVAHHPGGDQAAPPAGAGGRHRLVHVVPLQSLGLTTHSTQLVEGFMHFKSSAAPSRVLFFAGDAWNDFPPAVLDALKEGFAAGKAFVDVPVGGSLYLFDFVRMVQMDVATGAHNSIAWIDVHGRCFFPKAFAAERGAARPSLEIEVRMGENGGAAPLVEPIGWKKPSPEPLEEHSDESQVVAVAGSLESQRWAGLQVLDEGNKCYKAVANLFLKGMKRSSPETRITSIYKCSYGGLSAGQRLKAFLAQMEMTKSTRGTANLKFGWYGTSASGVKDVVGHGVGQPNNGLVGLQARGVYLTPPNSLHPSSFISEADGTGVKHVILCRIIMGNTEKVDTSSAQCHPSSDEFDCGVDDLENPTWFIVWGTHMNTRILPEYVVSFRTSDLVSRAKGTSRDGKRAIQVPLTEVIAELGNFLPSPKIHALRNLMDRVKEKKISRAIFFKNVRAIVGGDLLSSVIKKYCRSL